MLLPRTTTGVTVEKKTQLQTRLHLDVDPHCQLFNLPLFKVTWWTPDMRCYAIWVTTSNSIMFHNWLVRGVAHVVLRSREALWLPMLFGEIQKWICFGCNCVVANKQTSWTCGPTFRSRTTQMVVLGLQTEPERFVYDISCLLTNSAMLREEQQLRQYRSKTRFSGISGRFYFAQNKIVLGVSERHESFSSAKSRYRPMVFIIAL